MCFITHTKVIKAEILPRSGEQGKLSGSISIEKINFFQAFLISFAPLFIGTYIIALILHYIITSCVNYTIAIILIYIGISILSMLNPSVEDLRMIGRALQMTDKNYSMIQLIIIFVAISISYYIISFYEIVVYDLLMTLFFLSMFFYYIIKYFGLGLFYLFHKVRISRRTSKDLKYKTKVKHRKKNRGVEYPPSTQW